MPELLTGARPGRSGPARLLRSGHAVLAIQVGVLLLSLGLQLALARLLGVERYGDFAYATGWVLLLLLVGKAGAEPAALNFVARYCEETDWGRLRGFMRWALVRTCVAAGAVAATAMTVAAASRPWARTDLVAVFLVACLLLPVDALAEVAAAMLRALGRAASAQALVGLLRRLGFGLLLALSVWIGAPLDAATAMLANVAAGAVVLGVLALHLRRSTPPPAREADPVSQAAVWRSTTRSLFAASLFVAAISRVDVVLVGLLSGTAEAGVYGVASRIAAVAILGQTAINAVLAPQIARHHAAGETEQLERTAVACARAASAFALAAGAALAAAGPFLLRLFGEGFERGFVPLVLLLAAQLASALFGSVGNLLNMTGHHAEALRLTGFALALHVVMLLLLVPPFGALGAAASVLVSNLAWNLALSLRVRVRLGLNPTAVFRRRAG